LVRPYANKLRHPHTQPGDKWHLDEVFLTIQGQQYYLWRAVDPYGSVLGAVVQSRCDQVAAKRFFRKLLKEWQILPRAS